jgi:hypothetical protein
LSLTIHQYKINFLYVLKAYTHFNETEIESFRKEVKETFRNNFVKFFNDSGACGFELYEAIFNAEDYPTFIETHFKKLNGKCFCTIDNRLLLARQNSDTSVDSLLDNFRLLSELE